MRKKENRAVISQVVTQSFYVYGKSMPKDVELDIRIFLAMVLRARSSANKLLTGARGNCNYRSGIKSCSSLRHTGVPLSRCQ